MKPTLLSMQAEFEKANLEQTPETLTVQSKEDFRLQQGTDPKNNRYALQTFTGTNVVAEKGAGVRYKGAQEDRVGAYEFDGIDPTFQDYVAYAQVLNATVEELATAINDDDSLQDGATMVVSLVVNGYIITANLGDSRAYLVDLPNESQWDTKIMRLNCSHVPTEPTEQARITAAGGVVFGGRLNGVLAVSRALGDKKIGPGMSSEPGISLVRFESNQNSPYLVMCSDGIHDELTDGTILAALEHSKDPALDLRNLAYNHVSKNKSDNMVVIVAPIGAYQNMNKILLSVVLDGHAGDQVADYALQNFHTSFLKHLQQIFPTASLAASMTALADDEKALARQPSQYPPFFLQQKLSSSPVQNNNNNNNNNVGDPASSFSLLFNQNVKPPIKLDADSVRSYILLYANEFKTASYVSSQGGCGCSGQSLPSQSQESLIQKPKAKAKSSFFSFFKNIFNNPYAQDIQRAEDLEKLMLLQDDVSALCNALHYFWANNKGSWDNDSLNYVLYEKLHQTFTDAFANTSNPINVSPVVNQFSALMLVKEMQTRLAAINNIVVLNNFNLPRNPIKEFKN